MTGTTQTLTAAGFSTSITESAPPVGYTLTGISCTGLGSGGTATNNLVTRTVTLDAAATAAGSAIACTFTNSKLPTVAVTKISNGGTGTFTFTGTNGWSSQNITTDHQWRWCHRHHANPDGGRRQHRHHRIGAAAWLHADRHQLYRIGQRRYGDQQFGDPNRDAGCRGDSRRQQRLPVPSPTANSRRWR